MAHSAECERWKRVPGCEEERARAGVLVGGREVGALECVGWTVGRWEGLTMRLFLLDRIMARVSIAMRPE